MKHESEGFYMNGSKRKLSQQELNERVRQLCAEGPYDTGEWWMKLDFEDFEPFFRAENVCLRESPVVSVAAASSWVRRAVDELAAETGGTVTYFLLYVMSSGPKLEILTEIVAAAQGVIDTGNVSFVAGYRAMRNLKENEITVLALAAA